MLINKDNVPYLTRDNLTWLDSCNFPYIYDFDDKDYFAIQFLESEDCTHHKLKLAIPEEILDKIKNKELTLVLANHLEAFHAVTEVVYNRFVSEMNIPEDQILLLSSSPNILSSVRKSALNYNKKEIKVVWLRIYEYSVALREFFVIKSTPVDKNKKYNKKFICLNRRWRPHRAALVGLLKSKNLLNHGYVSLADCEGANWADIYDEILDVNNDPEFKEIFTTNKNDIINIPYLYVDTSTQEGNVDEFRDELRKFYEDTFFSVVTETPFYTSENYDNNIHLSEKTFKVISQRQPFLLCNTPYALKALRSIGYKTFHPFIDESYDNELNDGTRLIKILKEIEKLCNLSDSEIIDFIKNTEKICEHNYNNLVKYIELNYNNQEFKLSTKYSTRLN